MSFDLSDKGREKFYRNWFENFKEFEKNNSGADSSLKYLYLSNHVKNLESYEHQRKMYAEQMELFWKNKKSHSIICRQEKIDYGGAISIESQERERAIKKHEELLSKMSSSFKEDLEKIILQDPEVRSFLFNNN